MSHHDEAGLEGRLLKLGLIATFLGSVFFAGARPEARRPRLGVVDIGLMGLASHRIGRILAYERVGVPLREPFTATVADETGVDQTVVARGRGVRWAIGELVSCPICVASWAALLIYIGHSLIPGPTRALVTVLSAGGVAELTSRASESLEWTARAARRRSA